MYYVRLHIFTSPVLYVPYKCNAHWGAAKLTVPLLCAICTRHAPLSPTLSCDWPQNGKYGIHQRAQLSRICTCRRKMCKENGSFKKSQMVNFCGKTNILIRCGHQFVFFLFLKKEPPIILKGWQIFV